MPAYDRLIPALKGLLPAWTLAKRAREVSFIIRLRSIRASLFVWAVVLSRFGEGVPGFAEASAWYARLGGKQLWPRPFQKRFMCQGAVRLFADSFDAAVTPWRIPSRKVRHVLAKHFSDIVAIDTTHVHLAAALRRFFKAPRPSRASLKISLAISVFGRLPLFARVTAGVTTDGKLFPDPKLFPTRLLWLFDRGFLSYDRLRDLAAHQQFYLCPMRRNANPLVVAIHSGPRRARQALARHPSGVPLRDLLPKNQRLTKPWDLEVMLVPGYTTTDKRQVRSRLVLLQGPRRHQHGYLTNLAPSWKPKSVRELYRLRWQIELVFKEMKQDLALTAMPSANRHAVQTFAWASLLALVVSRLVADWLQPLQRIVGLEHTCRPALVTRALAGSARLLAACLRAPLRHALALLNFLRHELLLEAKSRDTDRKDTFWRLSSRNPLAALR
jgi:hypothetical protein